MTSQARRKLPIGVQSFREIREGNYYYVDKTPFIHKMLEEGSRYFLSRPRRFGKSLLVDTIRHLYEGNEPLFRGLSIHQHWDWSSRHPTLRLNFAGGRFREPGSLHTNLMAQLDAEGRRLGVGFDHPSAPERLAGLLETLHLRSSRRVAVLVDEYDKPILDTLDSPEIARANRDLLRDTYGILKAAEDHLRFVFLTGVSKFSKVSLFSGLNNLLDITMDPAHSAICGYADADLDTVFESELSGLDRERIRDWYNGYNWLGDEVYNPFDILLLFRRRKFGAYWFETGTPTFLLDTLLKRRVSSVELDGLIAGESLLSTFDVDDIAPEALLFQTGYLTIVGESDINGSPLYRLGYPNSEVRMSLNESFLRHLVKDASRQMTNKVRLLDLLRQRDFEGLKRLFRAFFASIPYEWYTNNDIADYEGYYASVFYSYFAALGLDITVEDSSNHGRLDMAVRFGANVYLFEFKVVEMEPEGAAMAQLRDRDYAAKYRGGAGEVYLVGVEFSRKTRNVVGFEVGRG